MASCRSCRLSGFSLPRSGDDDEILSCSPVTRSSAFSKLTVVIQTGLYLMARAVFRAQLGEEQETAARNAADLTHAQCTPGCYQVAVTFTRGVRAVYVQDSPAFLCHWTDRSPGRGLLSSLLHVPRFSSPRTLLFGWVLPNLAQGASVWSAHRPGPDSSCTEFFVFSLHGPPLAQEGDSCLQIPAWCQLTAPIPR